MATTQQTSNNSKKNAPAPDPNAPGAGQAAGFNIGADGAPVGWDEIVADKPHWKPEECQAHDVLAEFVSLERMPQAIVKDPQTGEIMRDEKTGEPLKKDWFVFNAKALRATKALGREGKLEDVAPGQEFAIPVSGELKKELYKKWENASRAGKVPAFWLKADKLSTIVVKGMKAKMWTYKSKIQPPEQQRARGSHEPMYVGFVQRAGGFAQIGPAPRPVAPPTDATPPDDDFLDVVGEDVANF